jgi:hypothetical protein
MFSIINKIKDYFIKPNEYDKNKNVYILNCIHKQRFVFNNNIICCLCYKKLN